ncbi:MAG TPA: hypothetical protein VD793_04145, partial [Gemmatimonadales bacterium]|nr:hypothetical protein [Gemmatimonadales bacterium]
LAARTVRLEDGTVIKVPPDPAGIHRSDGDGTLGDRVILPSLEAVARALEAGQAVMAAGVGWVESHEPLTIVAVRVVFFLPPPPLHRFDGVVASVNLDQRTVTLEGGTLIRVPDDDLIHDGEEGGDALESLSDVADALAEGERVVAHGVGELESTEPRILVAVKVLFVVEPPGLRRFEGTVMSVDLASHTLTLKGGTRIRMADETRVHSEGTGNLMLSSLEAVARAIADGQTVWTAGAGTVESEEPLIIVAAEIAFFARPPVYVFFEGTVESVDLEARTVTLEGGRLLSVSEGTEIVVTDHTLPSLEAVAEALEAGETVVAAGVAAPPAAEGEPEPVAKIVFVVAG